MDQEKKDMAALSDWFMRFKRVLPWRENHSPYRVWVSEVMLQQTQVSVVIPYFERWMELFPTTQALAQSDLDAVIKAWEGLGYYSRARNLHAAAREIMTKHAGRFPSNKEDLLKIKGLGPYTAGAIMAFAYKQRAAAVDGNVRRVIARYDAIEENIDLAKVQKRIEARTHSLLPEIDPHHTMEGLIELGALVCERVPKCGKCPLSSGCKAFAKGFETQLPIRNKRQKTVSLHRLVWILFHEGHVLIRKEKKGKVMADLWHFPFFEMNKNIDLEQVSAELESLIGKVTYDQELDVIKHGFTRYQATLYPHIWQAKNRTDLPGHTWVSIDEISKLPFCSGHRSLSEIIASYL